MTPLLPRLAREAGASLALALPIVLGQLTAVGMNVVDTVLAGHLGAVVLAAIAVGGALWSFVLVMLLGLMLGLSPMVAERHGACQHERIGPLFRQAVWLALIAGSVLGVLLRLFAHTVLGWFGVEPEVQDQGAAFLHGLALGAPALAIYFALRGLSEGMGRTGPTLYFGLAGLVVLAPLGYVMMYGRLGLPPMGAAGAGYATALTFWLQTLAFSAYLARHAHYRSVQPFQHWERPRLEPIRSLLALGVPMGMSVLMEASLFILVALLIGSLGAETVAAHQIAINVASVAFMIPLGIAMATTVRVGHALGRNDPEAIRWAIAGSAVLVFVAQCLSAGVMAFAPGQLAAIYTRDLAVAAQGVVLLRLAAIFQVADGFQALANGALRGLQDAFWPMLITAFSYWGIGLGAALWFGFGLGQGAPGMWLGLIAGLSSAALLLAWRLARCLRTRKPVMPAA